jgi:hypothetical protein
MPTQVMETPMSTCDTSCVLRFFEERKVKIELVLGTNFRPRARIPEAARTRDGITTTARMWQIDSARRKPSPRTGQMSPKIPFGLENLHLPVEMSLVRWYLNAYSYK